MESWIYLHLGFFIERNLLIPVIFYCSSWFNYYSLFSNAPLWIRVLLVYCVGLWWNPSCFIINYFREIYFFLRTFKWHWIFCCLNVVFHKVFPAVLTSLSWNALNSLENLKDRFFSNIKILVGNYSFWDRNILFYLFLSFCVDGNGLVLGFSFFFEVSWLYLLCHLILIACYTPLHFACCLNVLCVHIHYYVYRSTVSSLII